MEQYILKTDNLTKTFGSHKASDSISINVREGAIYGLIGRNGAGKNTLMKMITELSNPTSGSFAVKGYSGNDLKKVRRIVGSLIEAPGLYPDMTAFQNLKCKCLQCGIKDDERIIEVLSLVGLSDTGKKKTAKFSYGMKQRLGIAMSLIDRPELLVLDEPLNGLDPQGIHEFREMLLNLNQQGITLIISSHILDELAKIATDYGIIHKGRLVEETTEEALSARCESKVITNLIVNIYKHNPDGIRAKVSVTENNEKAVIRIADSGEPLPSGVDIFVPFVTENTARTAGNGTGLGLAVTKRVIERHGGKIYVEKANSDYTKMFVIRL